jgi:hypothetical protein
VFEGNSLAHGLPCVVLIRSDYEAEVIMSYAAEIGAIDHDGKEPCYVVRFPDQNSTELVTEAELRARLIPEFGS